MDYNCPNFPRILRQAFLGHAARDGVYVSCDAYGGDVCQIQLHLQLALNFQLLRCLEDCLARTLQDHLPDSKTQWQSYRDSKVHVTHLNHEVKFFNLHGDCNSRKCGPHDEYEMVKDG